MRTTARGMAATLRLGIPVALAASIGCGLVTIACGDDPSASVHVIVTEGERGLPLPLEHLRVEVFVVEDGGDSYRTAMRDATYDRAGRLEPWVVPVPPRSPSHVGRVLYRFRAIGERNGTAYVTAQARLVFLSGARVVLPLRLDASCVEIACPGDQTCALGACVDDFFEACAGVEGTLPAVCRDRVPDASPPTPPVDLGAPMDTGPPPPPVDMAVDLPDAGPPDLGPPDAGTCFDIDIGSVLGEDVQLIELGLDRRSSSCGDPDSYDVVMRWTPPAPGTYAFNACTDAIDTRTGVGVFADCELTVVESCFLAPMTCGSGTTGSAGTELGTDPILVVLEGNAPGEPRHLSIVRVP